MLTIKDLRKDIDIIDNIIYFLDKSGYKIEATITKIQLEQTKLDLLRQINYMNGQTNY